MINFTGLAYLRSHWDVTYEVNYLGILDLREMPCDSNARTVDGSDDTQLLTHSAGTSNSRIRKMIIFVHTET